MPTPTTQPWNPPNEPPDDETTVLLRIAEPSEPIWPGFHTGGEWRAADGARIAEPVTGWLHIDEAARLLDAARP